MKMDIWLESCPSELAAATLSDGTRSGMAAEIAGMKKALRMEVSNETIKSQIRIIFVDWGAIQYKAASVNTARPLKRSLRTMIRRRE